MSPTEYENHRGLGLAYSEKCQEVRRLSADYETLEQRTDFLIEGKDKILGALSAECEAQKAKLAALANLVLDLDNAQKYDLPARRHIRAKVEAILAATPPASSRTSPQAKG